MISASSDAYRERLGQSSEKSLTRDKVEKFDPSLRRQIKNLAKMYIESQSSDSALLVQLNELLKMHPQLVDELVTVANYSLKISDGKRYYTNIGDGVWMEITLGDNPREFRHANPVESSVGDDLASLLKSRKTEPDMNLSPSSLYEGESVYSKAHRIHEELRKKTKKTLTEEQQ